MTIPAENIIPNIAAGRRPTLTLDVALYEGYLEGSGLAEDDRRVLLEDLWAIIVGFVDLGFAVEPAKEIQGEPFSAHEDLAEPTTDLIECDDRSTTSTFRRAAVQVRPASVEARK